MGKSVIVNEKTAKILDTEHLIGHKLYTKNDELEIVGVVKDFHGTRLGWDYRSLSYIRMKPDVFETLVVKLAPENIGGTITAIEKSWKSVLPGQQFKYTFLDDEIYKNYNEHRANGYIFFAITLLSIAIACFGILGLVSYTTMQRTKEIGIRKVLGCNVSGILTLLSKEYIILIVISNIIAWPCAYLLMQSFLQEFPFKIAIGVGTFFMAGVSTLIIALSTTSVQSFKAAITNPVNSLRYE